MFNNRLSFSVLLVFIVVFSCFVYLWMKWGILMKLTISKNEAVEKTELVVILS